MNEPYGATPLEPEELEDLRFGHVETRADLDRLEQANIQEGMLWLERQRGLEVLSEGFARELHRRLFGEVWRWAGRFRSTEKTVGIAPERVGVELRKLLDDCRYWINNETWPPLELALRFHHRAVLIHLFPNGNGRHARIWTDALCIYELDVAPVAWSGNRLQVDSAHRNAYIAALREADRGDIQPLLTLFERLKN